MSKSILLSALAMLFVLFVFTGTPAKAAEIIFEPVFNQTEARSMLESINKFRTGDEAWYWNSDNETKTVKTDLKELVYDYNLEKVAMQRAAEIAISWGHTRPDGRSTWTAYSDFSYYSGAKGENIAAGQSSADTAFVCWREDNDDYSGQGHRRNMLNSGYTAIGIASVTVNGCKYWVQEFSGSVSSSEETDANDSSTATKVSVSDADISLGSIQDLKASVDVGSTIDIPNLEAEVTFKKAWPSGRKVKVSFLGIFDEADDEFVSLVSGQIKGLKEGSGVIKGSLLGEEVKLAVQVNAGANQNEPAPTGEGLFVGDINCDGEINSKDVTQLRRFLAGGWNVTVNKDDADINGDGEVNAKDVTQLRRYLAGGWGVELPKKTIAASF